MLPNDPRHGTYAGAQAHRREGTPLCEPCTEARRVYQRRLSYDHERGRKRRVDPRPVATHLLTLERAGVPLTQTARQAGVARGTVFRAVGRGYPRSGTIEVTKAAAILRVPIPEVPGDRGYVPRIGVIRRIRALNRLGWPRTELAARLGISSQNLTQLVNGCRGTDHRPNAWVQAATWHRVATVYAELCMTPGPSKRAAGIAERKGWAPPLAWDNIDDPNEQPAVTGHIRTDRATEVRDLAADGENATQIARRLGIKRASLEKWCLRNLPDVWRVIVAREGDWNTTGNAASHTRMGGAA